MKVLRANDHYAHVGGTETMLLQTLEAQGVETLVVYQHPSTLTEGPRQTHCVPGLGDQPVLQRALALALVNTPCRLIVDGDGPALPQARQLAHPLGLTDQATSLAGPHGSNTCRTIGRRPWWWYPRSSRSCLALSGSRQ